MDSADGTTSQVAEAEWSQRLHTSITYNQAGDRRAYVYKDDIYLVDASGPRQLTRTAATESAPMFVSDGRRVAFESDGQMFVHDPASGLTGQVSDIRFSKDPDQKEDFHARSCCNNKPSYASICNQFCVATVCTTKLRPAINRTGQNITTAG